MVINVKTRQLSAFIKNGGNYDRDDAEQGRSRPLKDTYLQYTCHLIIDERHYRILFTP